MKQQGILHTIADGVRDACHIWYDELRLVLKDEGVLIFFVIVPLIYPLLYSWIYNNEAVREVPVVVVDDSHSAMSRQFIRMCDASPDVQIKYHASDMDEAQMLMGRQIVKAIYRIPADFESNLMRMQQSVVSVYCDMSLMLTYKAAYQTALAVSQTMNKEIQIQLAGRYTKREEQIQAAPLQCDDVALYNPGGGYGSAILPAVLMLILQQTLVLGIGMAAGTARETNRFSDLVPIQSHYHGTFRIVLGKSMAYFMIYAVMGTWLTVVVPRLFNFPHLAQWYNLLMLMLPYTLACIFFGITVSCLVRYRENVMLLMVFVSIPLLFLSGASWPQSAIPGFWQGISWLFPSTFGVRAYVRLNSMGGSIGDVLFEYQVLWLHVLVYFIVACLVYRHHINLARRHAEELKTE
jgi:ABC-2 type transport system permease protein